MTASPSARFAPIGALRAGVLLLVAGGLMAWALDSVPRWIWLGTIFIGGVLVAVSLGIRMLRA